MIADYEHSFEEARNMEYMEGFVIAKLVLLGASVNDELMSLGYINASKHKIKNHIVQMQSPESNVIIIVWVTLALSYYLQTIGSLST